jgi:hypothetical protein
LEISSAGISASAELFSLAGGNPAGDQKKMTLPPAQGHPEAVANLLQIRAYLDCSRGRRLSKEAMKFSGSIYAVGALEKKRL